MDPTHYILGGLAGLLPGGAAAYSILNSVLKGKAPAIIKEAEQTGDHIKEKKIPQTQGGTQQRNQDANCQGSVARRQTKRAR